MSVVRGVSGMSGLTPIPFFDRTRVDAPHEAELTEVFQRVLRSGRYILGPEVEAFEAECAAYLGAKHAVGVSSGTDALVVALLALGVGPGDEVICPAFTFAATANAVVRVGARPVFVDVLPGSLCVDPGAAEEAITERTRAIVPVHLFGASAPMGELLEVGARRGVAVVEDAAQAFGARWGGDGAWVNAGVGGVFGCFSFFPTKNLGGFGDGGLVVTGDGALAERVRVLRAQGARKKYWHEAAGGNWRLDALQAALLRKMLPRVGERLARRREIAGRYDELLRAVGAAGAAGAGVELPEAGEERTYNQYVIRLKGQGRRDALRGYLQEQGVGTEVYYPTPLHLMPSFAGAGGGGGAGSLPVAEQAVREVLALPVFPGLRDEEIERVVEGIVGFPR